MPEGAPSKDPRFKGKRYEARTFEGDLVVPPPQESPEVSTEKIAAAEALMADFEKTYDLSTLHAITGFATNEERLASPRQAALEALLPIFKLLKSLEHQVAVSVETYTALLDKERLLTRAVGVVTSDPSGEMMYAIVHDR